MSHSPATPALLVIGTVGQDLRDAMAARFTLVDHILEGPAAKSVDDIPPGHVAVLTRALFGLPASVMAAMPQLRLAVSLGAGLEKFDLAEAARRRIAIAHTPDELTEDVADYAIGLVYAAQRRLLLADAHVRQGRWAKRPMPLSRRVCDKRLGVIGLGKIGRRVAAKASALGLTVAYHARRPYADVAYAYHPDALSLAAASDILVLACAGTPETRHIVDAGVLTALGPTGIVVNIARGSVIDEDALLAALIDLRIAGAALDVFETEPNPDPRFLGLDNVLLSPHAASLTVETRIDLISRLTRSAEAFFAGEPFPDAAAASRDHLT